MNNLKLMKVRCLPIDDIKGDIIYVSIGAERKKKEVYYIRGTLLVCVDLSKGEESILASKVTNVIRAEYMSTQNNITIATSTNVIIINCDTKEFYKCEFDKELVQVGWNSTYDYLAIVFKHGTLQTFVFDTRFELVRQGEGNIFTTVPRGEDVGWGSSITQFQGPNIHDEIQPTETHPFPTDDQKPVISWRGSANEFIVSYLDEGDERVFKGFDHLCLPKVCSEVVKGIMYGPTVWKPQGNIIAAAMFQDEKYCIGLYERNGLFRKLFYLVDIYWPITHLSWSACGKVLSVTQEDSKGQIHICLYITSNARWYLKQHLFFSKMNILCSLTWILTSPQCVELLAVTRNQVIQYKYKFEFDFDHRNKLIASIDGKTIRIHGLEESVDPAPTCTGVMVLDNPINMIAFHPSKDLAAAVDSLNNLYCFSVNGREMSIVIQIFLLTPVFPLNINHLFWKGDNPHIILENLAECNCFLHEVDLTSGKCVKKQQFDVRLYAIEHIYAVGNVMITHDGKYRTIYKAKENPFTSPNLPYPLQVIPLKFGGEIFCLILTPQQELYLEEEFICRGITSMLLHKDFLLLTDNTNLYTLQINRYFIETLAADGLSEFHIRPLNETAYLVCLVEDSPNIILHTPRGNLELISCRSMEIRIVEEKLSKGQWSEAIKFMRLARMNWNLLIDLDSDRFYNNIAAIVTECNSQHVLTSVVAEISDDNCLTTVYKKAIEMIPYTKLNKRQDFLNELGAFLDRSGTFSEYLPTILKVCLDQNNLEKAMTYASNLLNRETKGNTEKAEQAINLLRIHVEADDLFKAALQIFDVKLADFIAMKCQMNPQEVDPILNELKTMDHLDRRLAIHLRYQNWQEAIAYMLRKQDVDREEILSFIREHDVAKRAYFESLKMKIAFTDDIAQLYVPKLVSQGCHHEAAVILVQHHLYNEAVHQFKMALDYQKCAEYLAFTSFTETESRELYADLADKLVAKERISEAANIYEHYLGDYSKAVKVLVLGRKFMEALRLSKKYSQLNLIDVHVLPKMLTTIQTIMDRVDESTVEFKKHLDRLKKLRNIKKYNYEQLKKRSRAQGSDGASTIASNDSFGSRRLGALERERIAEFDTGLHQPDSEVQSIISVGSDDDQPFFADSDNDSVITVRSRRSSRSYSSSSTVTQKQVRKMEKQKQDTTEGSRFEDIALMREMYLMITAIFKYGPEAGELFLRLIEYSFMDLNALKHHHSKLLALQQLMKNEVYNIWDEEFRADSNATHISENFCFIDEQFRTFPFEVENPGFSWVLEMLKD